MLTSQIDSSGSREKEMTMRRNVKDCAEDDLREEADEDREGNK